MDRAPLHVPPVAGMSRGVSLLVAMIDTATGVDVAPRRVASKFDGGASLAQFQDMVRQAGSLLDAQVMLELLSQDPANSVHFLLQAAARDARAQAAGGCPSPGPGSAPTGVPLGDMMVEPVLLDLPRDLLRWSADKSKVAACDDTYTRVASRRAVSRSRSRPMREPESMRMNMITPVALAVAVCACALLLAARPWDDAARAAVHGVTEAMAVMESGQRLVIDRCAGAAAGAIDLAAWSDAACNYFKWVGLELAVYTADDDDVWRKYGAEARAPPNVATAIARAVPGGARSLRARAARIHGPFNTAVLDRCLACEDNHVKLVQGPGRDGADVVWPLLGGYSPLDQGLGRQVLKGIAELRAELPVEMGESVCAVWGRMRPDLERALAAADTQSYAIGRYVADTGESSDSASSHGAGNSARASKVAATRAGPLPPSSPARPRPRSRSRSRSPARVRASAGASVGSATRSSRSYTSSSDDGESMPLLVRSARRASPGVRHGQHDSSMPSLDGLDGW